MAIHLAVQALATLRNQQAELFVHYVLHGFFLRLFQEGRIASRVVPELHQGFARDDCSDIFDHFATVELTAPVGHLTGSVEFWAQTTCYKGNQLAVAEPNKVYEIRETLIESLGLRRWMRADGINCRTIHFTIGPASYAYGWLRLAKDNAFDLSIYPPPQDDINVAFRQLNALIDPLMSPAEVLDVVTRRLPDNQQLHELARSWEDALYAWFATGLPSSVRGDQQADLMTVVRDLQSSALREAVDDSVKGGEDIKGRVLSLLNGGATHDTLVIETAKKVVSGNPFLEASLTAQSDWRGWVKTNLAIPSNCGTLFAYLQHLWTLDGPRRLVVRRLLVRVRAGQPLTYVADIGVKGLTERNLYNAVHLKDQVRAVSSLLLINCQAAGIQTPSDLYRWLASPGAAALSAASRKVEIRNGTNLRPSFLFVEEAAKPTYRFLPLQLTGLPPAIPYHAAFGSESVRPYANLRAVLRSSSERVLAILKVKFFRPQEFPRRAKEESYVGLTARFRYEDGKFLERYPGLPIVMFVDMPTGYVPPAFAVTRLVTAGWRVFFSLSDFRRFLDSC